MTCDIFLKLQNGAKMPALGFGTWQAKDDILEAALEEALKVGYRHIDTAQAYENEHVIGKVLKRWFDSGKLKREDIFLTTKLSPFQMAPDNVEKFFEESLKKLQVDYVDLYLIHFPLGLTRDCGGMHGRTDFHYLDIWKKMECIYDTGKAKSIGISNFNARQVENLLKNCRIKPVNNQVEMHVYRQQKEVVDFCHKNNITIVAYSSLGSRGSTGVKKDVNPLADKTVAEIAKKHSKSPAQILLRYMLELGVSTIPKSVTPDRIKENLDIFDFKLDVDDINKLKSLDRGLDGRLFDSRNMAKLAEHPEYPNK